MRAAALVLASFRRLFGPKALKRFKLPGGAIAVIAGRVEDGPNAEWVKVKIVDTPYGGLIPVEHGGIGAIVSVKKEWIEAGNREIERELRKVENK